jgi:hypothetical protein
MKVMFIKEGILDLLPVYPNQIDYLHRELGEPKPNQRAFVSKTNAHYAKTSQGACRYAASYLASQHHPALHSLVPRRYYIVEQVEIDAVPFFNTTYFDRVCQAVFVPMQGSITYGYAGIDDKVFKLEVGRAYAVNTRAPRSIVEMTPGFRCFVSIWIDFDLAYYLKEHDGVSKMERRKDEYFERRPQQPADVQSA